MGDASELCTEQGMSMLLAHRKGECGANPPINCEYCGMAESDFQQELSRFDESFAPRGSLPKSSIIYNGRYTLKLQDGGHQTFKIHTRGGHGSFAGKRIISLLTRADNDDEDSYVGFGFVDDRGIHVWTRYIGVHRKGSEHADLIWKLANGECIDGYELLVERRCLICNRPLTDPESHSRGIGPHCLRKLQ